MLMLIFTVDVEVTVLMLIFTVDVEVTVLMLMFTVDVEVTVLMLMLTVDVDVYSVDVDGSFQTTVADWRRRPRRLLLPLRKRPFQRTR